MAFWSASGSMDEMQAPMTVPKFQPKTGMAMSPKRYAAESRPGFKDATTKVSSVTPKPKPMRFKVPMPLSNFCPRDSDISIYRKLMTKVVIASSMYPAPARIRFVPANCPALVRFVREMKHAAQTGSPPETAIKPKVKATGAYPRPMGNPAFNPLLNSVFQFILWCLQVSSFCRYGRKGRKIPGYSPVIRFSSQTIFPPAITALMPAESRLEQT